MRYIAKSQLKLSDAANRLSGSPVFDFLTKARKLEQQGKKVYHFEIGDPDFDTPLNIRKAGIDSIKKGETHYTNPLGIEELRKAICLETKRSLGFEPDLEQVAIGPAISLIYFVIRCTVNPGEEVIVPDPGFASYYSAFDFVGIKWRTIPLLEKNGFRMSPDDIAKKITSRTKLIIINSPHNPTGSVMHREEILKIAELASKKNIYLLSDEVYGKMTYGYPHYSPATYDKCLKNIIVLNSFSKTYAMTGWRLGWIVAPENIVKKIGLMIEMVLASVPPFIQMAGVEALKENGAFLKKIIAEYCNRRDIMVQLLNQMPGVKCLKPEGAFYVFPSIDGTGMTSQEFARFAIDSCGVILLPGTSFGPSGEGYVRLAYTNSEKNIREGLLKLKTALKNL